MGSRIRDNIKHLFQCFCEVVAPRGDKEAWIIQKFPDSYRDEEVLKSVPKFAYPCEFRNTVVQHYSFVLTSIDSKWTFGFCRHDPKTETALVILSFLPWHESFYKLLNHVAEITHNCNAEELYRFLNTVYENNVPEPGTVMQVSFNNGESIFSCKCPNQFQLPSIPENRNLTEYYSAVDGHNMMVIFASMLYERRIIFTSKKLSRLSACVQSANAVIYPMNWQHIFIPVLPMALMDYLFAPMPYLIGVPEPVLQRVKRSDLGEVIILDADSNTVETPFEDLESLPADVVNSLKRQLRNRAALLGDGVSRAFLKALVQLIGGYRDALKFQQGQKITFDPDAFIESRPMSMQAFLRKMLQLQIFQQFIEERLDMLNSGLGFSDEFEMEACNYSGKSSSKLKQQYKEWTSTMKKEGTAFFKTVKSKANPAMKSAVKTVRERGKEVRTAYKGIRSKWRDSQPRDSSSSHEGNEYTEERNGKPRSAPTSPINKRRQTVPGVKVKAIVSYRRESNMQRKRPPSGNRMKPYCALSPLSDQSPSEGGQFELSSSPPGQDLTPLDMNLMGDLQDIFKKCSALTDVTDVSPPVDRTRLVSEVNLMSSLRHPNIVEYHDRIIDKISATLYIIMEWCPGGDLSVLITKCRKKNLSLDEGFIWRVLYQIARALQACHSQIPSGTLLHRDVKSANVFLDSENNAKLGDFGLARILNSDASCSQTFVGTPYYMSPEVIMGGAYSKKSDVWSLGCLVYELCSLSPPFKASNIKHLAQKIIAGRFQRIPAHYSEDLHNIITVMLSSKPCARPTVDVIIQNPVVLSHVIQDCINAKLSIPKSLHTAENPCETAEKVKIVKQDKHAMSSQVDVQGKQNDNFSKERDCKFQDLLSRKLEDLKRKEAALQLKELAVAERERAVQKKERDLNIGKTVEGRSMTEGRSQHKSREVKVTSWKQKTPHLYHIHVKDEDTSFSADTGDTSILPTSAKLIVDTKECFMKKPNERRVHFDTVPVLDAVEYTYYDRHSTLHIRKPAVSKTSEKVSSETSGFTSIKHLLHRKPSTQVLQNVEIISKNNVGNSNRPVLSQWKKAGTIPRAGKGNCLDKENKHPTVSPVQHMVEMPLENILTRKFSSAVNFL